MATVKCKLCSFFEDGQCSKKKRGGKAPSVHPNKNRSCSKFYPDPVAMAKEADKLYDKKSIPIYSPTWRYYASDRELKELNEEKGSLFIRTNPIV